MNNKSLLITMVAIIVCSAAKAQKIPLDSMVRFGKLSNGFTYYIRHNEEPKHRVVLYLANKVGSLQEDENQRGLAHFMEHMSFNGTTHFPKNELINYLQKAGVRFGADINAYTSFVETVYQLPLPSDKPDILKNGLEIIHDWAHGATLSTIEIDKERGVVLEEKRSRKGADERMQKISFPLLVNNSRYAARLPIGTDEVLTTFKPETLRSFYHDWYRPNLQALIVVGDVDVDQMEKIIKEKFADLKNPVIQKPWKPYAIALNQRSKFIPITDPEMTATTVEIIIKQPELTLQTMTQYRSSIVRSLFNIMINARIRELQRSADPPFLQATAGINNFIGGLDAFNIAMTAKPGSLEKSVKAVWREMERIRLFGFTPTETERAKASFFKQIESAFQEKDKNASENHVQEYLQHFLHGTAAPGISYEYNLIKKVLSKIEVTEINDLIKAINKKTDRDILIMAPEKEKAGLPNEDLFTGWIKSVETETITMYRDETSTENFLKTPPLPGKIISEQRDDELGITTIMLSNGIKVLLKPTGFKNNEIQFSGFSSGGTSLYSDAEYQSAAAANIIPSFGAGNYSATQLAKFLSGKRLRVQPFINERFQGVNGGTVNEDLETSLKMVYAFITEPRKDSAIFQGLISRSKESLLNRADDPGSVFQDTISSVLSNHNVRRTGPSLKKIDQISLERAYTIYRERFANNRNFTFVFVGSIDTITIKPLLEKYLASLPASGNIDTARNLHISIPEGTIERKVYKGTEPKATVTLVFSGPFAYSFANEQKMEALKEIIQIRLIERLREDEAGVYSTNTRINVTKFPEERFSLTISFECAPQNSDKLITSVLDEIDKLKKAGPSQVNVEKFIAEEQRSIETALTTNSFWLSYITNQLQNKEALSLITDFSKQLNMVTAEEVKEAAAKYLNGKNYIKLVLLPEQKPRSN